MPSSPNKVQHNIHNNNVKHQVGSVIVRLLQTHKLDESSLAKACNISLASLSRIKNNPDSNPTISTLRPIAEFFNISIDQLLGYSPLNKKYQNNKTIPVISNGDINNWLNNKTTAKPIEHWQSCDIETSDHTFATNYELDSSSSVLKNCLLFVDPKKTIKQQDLVLIFNSKRNEYSLRIISIDDHDKFFIKPIEAGNFDYISLESCQKYITIIGAVIESRLQYNVKTNSSD